MGLVVPGKCGDIDRDFVVAARCVYYVFLMSVHVLQS